MEQIVLNRIHDLLTYRTWFRKHRWADWPAIRTEYEIELRALVRLARQARKAEAAKPDPMDQFKSYAEWSASSDGEVVGYHDWQIAGPK